MPWRATCPMEERLKFILEFERGDLSVSELCRQYGISRKTGYKWYGRYRELGVSGLSDLSRAPLRPGHAMGDEAEALILSVRHRYPSWGPKKIRAYLLRQDPSFACPAASSIGELLQRSGLVVPRRVRHRAPPRTSPFAACEAANDVWCIDFKGWFRCQDGRRCDPLTLADGESRYLLRCQALPGSGVDHVWPVVEAAFREYGLPRALRSDNGPPFASVGAGGLSPFAVKLVKAGVMPDRIDPGQPQQNGRLERLHLTLKQETASPPAGTLRAQARRFRSFQRYYNEERPHEALGQTPPAEHYTPSPRPYSGRLQEPRYPDDWLVRRVRRAGDIKWRGKHLYISESLAAEPVGLEEQPDGSHHIWFGPVLLGNINTNGEFLKPKRPKRKTNPVK